MSSLRSERARRRAARQRNQRMILIIVAVLILAVISYFIFSSLSANGDSPGKISGDMITTTSGLKYLDLVAGKGAEAKTGDTVSVHYTGWLADGTKFDSSVDRGTPFEFILGAGRVIRGWDEGVTGMKVGGKRRLEIPPDLAYGIDGYPPVIPQNATLTFEVELLEIK